MAQITLNSSGVASNGSLVLQSNGTTTAATFDTSQKLTLPNDAVVNGLTVGRGAGAVSTNTAVGASALAANTTGDRNFAAGGSALAANTTGVQNAASGYFALTTQTTGNYNAAFGAYALNSNTTASGNTAVGASAGYTNTTGNITAFGAGSLYSNTTGVANCAFGGSYATPLQYNTTGSYNTAIGDGSLRFNTTASNNTAVGYQAGYSNTTGANLVALGYQAGYSSNANNNTFIGYYAGQGTTGTLNTFVGVNGVGYLVSSGTRNTIIGGYSGNQGGLDIRTASNYIVLSDGDGNPRLISNGSGFFGLGCLPAVIGGDLDIIANQNGLGIGYSTSVYRRIVVQSSGNTAFISSGNTASLSSAGAWTNASDARLKKNITDIKYGLSTVLATQPKSYQRNDVEGQYIGFIAQELKQQVPEVVFGSDDEQYTVDYGSLVAVAFKAIQELKAEFDAYKEAHP